MAMLFEKLAHRKSLLGDLILRRRHELHRISDVY